MNLKRIDALNRIATTLMLSIVAALTVYASTQLQTTARAGKIVARNYYWYERFSSLDRAFEAEQYAVERYLISPGTATRRGESLARAAATRTLREAQLVADSPALNRTLDRIAQASARVEAAIDRLAVLRRSAPEHTVLLAYASDFLPPYYVRSAIIHGAAMRWFERGRATGTLLQRRGAKIGWLLFAVGVSGLLVLIGLLYTVHAYRDRATGAMKDEIERLERAALLDSLTSLGNHRAFYEDFDREIARARRHGHPLTLAVLDIDDFKELNDTGGHQLGDAMLVDLAGVLRSGRRADRAYRVGGDEFALLLPNTDAQHAAAGLDRIRTAAALRMGGTTVSIGYAQLHDDLEESELYDRADAALYEAKRHGRNTCVEFAEMRAAKTIYASRSLTSLRELLGLGRIDMAYQPIWDLETNAVLGFEALARPASELGFSGPQELFDVAEHSRRSAALDALCMRSALGGVGPLPHDQLLFLNLTPETLVDAAFDVRELLARIREVELNPERVVIELTERRLGELPRVIAALQALRNAGLLVALDDTGSGSAGLELLGSFGFDFVKIDAGIVRRAPSDRRARAVLAGIVAIAHEQGAYVIAEGIECAEQIAFLRSVGSLQGSLPKIGGAQGFFLGAPLLGSPLLVRPA